MEVVTSDRSIDHLIAQRLKALRNERGWSLDELASRSGVSRATLSRLENSDVSPTASVLGKLAAAFGMTISRLMQLVEERFAPLIPRERQLLWSDPAIGFRRRSVSPPAQSLAGEVLECEIDPDTRIDYDATPREGLEHHLFLVDGRLEVTVGGNTHHLNSGDCLRYQLAGASRFSTPSDCGAHYFIFLV
ncbi:MAG: helix-turn-helix transcriptional regulator [Rhizobiales bacterium]|nr:helix-turn-helix transcriptional regulator [Hyphomicrobiales bacterium]